MFSKEKQYAEQLQFISVYRLHGNSKQSEDSKQLITFLDQLYPVSTICTIPLIIIIPSHPWTSMRLPISLVSAVFN
jgi:hypothetical protein